MQWKSRKDCYGAVAALVHWTSAIFIIALLASGFLANGAEPAAKYVALRFHAVFGTAVLLLTLFRIAWWAFADRRPLAIEGTPRLQATMSRAVHNLFYVLIIGMAASGIGTIILSGAGPILLGNGTVSLPDFSNLTPRQVHGLGAIILMSLLALHVAAALYHHLVKRDEIQKRIGFAG